MSFKPILIVSGEKNSIFFEIFFKALKKIKFKSPLILISSLSLVQKEKDKYKFYKKIKILKINDLKFSQLDNKTINLINVDDEKQIKLYSNLDNNKNFIEKCFNVAFKLIKIGFTNKFINGPISKKKIFR